MRTYQSSSSEKTKALGGRTAKKAKRLAQSARRKNAVVIGLIGDLGSGKTTFTQGFLRGFGVKKRITSPTFVLIKRYNIPKKPIPYTLYPIIHHMDSYRLNDHRHLETLDFKKIITDPRNIVLIEWAEKIKKALPKDTFWIRFRHGKKENERKISFK